MMGYSSQPKVILVNLPKKFPFWARTIQAQFGPKLLNLISHDSFSETLFEILQYDGAKQIGKGRFSYFSEFQKPCSMVWYNSQRLVVLVNFPKVPFFDYGRFGQKLCNLILIICSVIIFFRWHSIMVNNSQTKAMLVTFYKRVPFREVTRTQFGPKVCNFLCQDLLFENFLRCCSIKEYSWQTIVTINFAKKSLFGPINKLDPT